MTEDSDYTMNFKGLTVNLTERSKVWKRPKQETPTAQESAAVDGPKQAKTKRAPSAIDQIIIIMGIAVGAIAISGWLGSAAMDKGNEVSAKIQEGSGSSSSTSTEENPLWGTIQDAAGKISADGPEGSASPSAGGPDISGALPYLGIAGLGVGGVAVTVLGVGGAKKLRRRNLELRALEEARAEDRKKAQAAWQKYADIHRDLSAKILKAETDWDMLFSYPTLVDSTVPQTRELHRLMRALDAETADAPAELNLAMGIGGLPYPKLVLEAQEAWNAAWSFAQRTGTQLIPKPERKKIDQIVKLLRLARDGGGSEHERSVAYERASKLIGELHFVRVPEVALQSIEAERRPMIEASAGADGAGSDSRSPMPMEMVR